MLSVSCRDKSFYIFLVISTPSGWWASSRSGGPGGGAREQGGNGPALQREEGSPLCCTRSFYPWLFQGESTLSTGPAMSVFCTRVFRISQPYVFLGAFRLISQVLCSRQRIWRVKVYRRLLVSLSMMHLSWQPGERSMEQMARYGLQLQNLHHTDLAKKMERWMT